MTLKFDYTWNPIMHIRPALVTCFSYTEAESGCHAWKVMGCFFALAFFISSIPAQNKNKFCGCLKFQTGSLKTQKYYFTTSFW